MNNKLILRTENSPYGDITKGSVLSQSDLDNNQIFLKGESISGSTVEDGIILLKKYNGNDIVISALSCDSLTGCTVISNLESIVYQQNQLVTGSVTYLSGLTFDITPLVYIIDGVFYNIPNATQVTLASGDTTYDRIDVIYADISGNTGVIQGTPSDNPVKPGLGPDSQVEVSFVSIPAGSMAPAITSTLVYDEMAGPPTEWTVNSFSTPFVIPNSTTQAYSGTKSVRFSAATISKLVEFSSSTLFNTTNQNVIQFAIKNPIAWPSTARLQLSLLSSTNIQIGNVVQIYNGTYGFSSSNITTWQIISVPTSAFALTTPFISKLRFTVNITGTQKFNAYIDQIKFIQGIPTVSTNPNWRYMRVDSGSNIGASTPNDTLILSGGTNIGTRISGSNTIVFDLDNNIRVTGLTATTISATTYLNLPSTGGGDSYWVSGSTGNYSIKQVTDTGLDATGNYAVAQGDNTLAQGEASHSEGVNTQAIGDGSHAEGLGTTASGKASHSEGGFDGLSNNPTLASGISAHAEGAGTIASGWISHAEGLQTTASGIGSHSEGNATIASNNASHAEGGQTTASGDASHAEGASTTASGDFSHSENVNTIASGYGSHAEGAGTTASGYTSHAEGYQTTALGDVSHASGYGTISSGQASHSEGESTIASGINSHAEGQSTTASGYASHSEGGLTTASGQYSHVGGNQSIASGQTSFVHGSQSIAGGTSTIVLGDNITGTTDNTVYTPDIVVGVNKQIIGGTGEIDFYTQTGVALTSDNSNYVTPYIWVDSNVIKRAGFYDDTHSKSIDIIADNDDGLFNIGSSKLTIWNDNARLAVKEILTFGISDYGSFDIIKMSHNQGITGITTDQDKLGTIISSRSSYIETGVTNSVILGGTGITATQSNTAYVDNLNIKTVTSASTATTVTAIGVDSNGNVVRATSGGGYRVYTALLTQTGTNNPVATILENSIGNIVWSYNNVGIFVGTLTGVFIQNKTICQGEINNAYANAEWKTNIGRNDNDTIYIYSFDNTNNNVNGLGEFQIEIRIYN